MNAFPPPRAASSGGGTSRPPRLKDVAETAGVSIQTVSNVLNGRRGFTPETRDRVLAVVEELGFRPNRAARNLRTQRHGLFAFDLSGGQLNEQIPIHIEFLRSTVIAASRHDYRIVVLSRASDTPETWVPDAAPKTLDSFREVAMARDVDGFVLSDSHPGDPRVTLLHELGIPFVVYGRTAPSLPQRWVDVDNVAAIEKVVDYLVGRGHRRFAYIGYPDDFFWTVERREAMRLRLEHHGLRLRADSKVACTADEVDSHVGRLMKQRWRPTAIVAGSDSLAVRAVASLRHLGFEVGSDVAVTGFDGGHLQHAMLPELTTLSTPTEEIAERLVSMLAATIAGEPDPQNGELLDVPLTIGTTA